MNHFTQFVINFSSIIESLPLFHTTDGYGFRDIINKNRLSPSPCKVFKKECILYLFYGRPAYRSDINGSSTSLSVFFPVCFILDPKCVKIAKRVFPFDSGAFDGGLFSDHMHGNMSLGDFLINPNLKKPEQIPIPETPSRIVSAFYEDNTKYYSCSIQSPANYPSLHFEVECYLDLIQSKTKTNYDDRRSTIEIQLESDVSLSSSTVLAVVLPLRFMEDKEVRDTIVGKWKAYPITYDTFHSSPSHFTIMIIEKVKNFFLKKGYLS